MACRGLKIGTRAAHILPATPGRVTDNTQLPQTLGNLTFANVSRLIILEPFLPLTSTAAAALSQQQSRGSPSTTHLQPLLTQQAKHRWFLKPQVSSPLGKNPLCSPIPNSVPTGCFHNTVAAPLPWQWLPLGIGNGLPLFNPSSNPHAPQGSPYFVTHPGLQSWLQSPSCQHLCNFASHLSHSLRVIWSLVNFPNRHES